MIKILLLEALDSLRATKLRTFLNILGIIIGVWSVITLLSVGEGARNEIRSSIEEMGSNLLIITPGIQGRALGGRSSSGAQSFTIDDVKAISTLPDVLYVSPITRGSTQAVVGPSNELIPLSGVYADYFTLNNWDFDAGEPFSEREVRAASLVAVIGSAAAESLFGADNPLGRIIRLDSVPFTVIGLLKSKGQSLIGEDQDNTIIIPFTTAQRRLFGSRNPGSVRTIMVQAVSDEALPRTQQDIEDILRNRRRNAPGGRDEFTVKSLTELAEQAEKISGIMTMVLGSIGGISLLVGGIGIMNMMLVSVTERTREIGIRKAIGARRAYILWQFLIEAMAISAAGCVLGVIVGIASAYGIEALRVAENLKTEVTVSSVVISFGVCLAIGLFFGYYPARKAARLKPIEALRYQ